MHTEQTSRSWQPLGIRTWKAIMAKNPFLSGTRGVLFICPRGLCSIAALEGSSLCAQRWELQVSECPIWLRVSEGTAQGWFSSGCWRPLWGREGVVVPTNLCLLHFWCWWSASGISRSGQDPPDCLGSCLTSFTWSSCVLGPAGQLTGFLILGFFRLGLVRACYASHRSKDLSLCV